MRPRILALLYLATVLPALGADPVPPQIQNLTARQRPGTFLVEISFDLVDPDSTALLVFAEASVDGGATYPLPVFPASGDLGIVTPGTGKRIAWQAWDAWPNNATANARVRLVVDDTLSQLPAPPGPSPNPDLAWIPPGSFSHGSWHVRISRGFWMGKREVTQAEYLDVIGSNPSTVMSPTFPVHNVSQSWANTYCQTLTARERAANRIPEGWVYRLPTEGEWELAARAGTATDYYFGDPNVISANSFTFYNANSGGRPHQVGERGQNRFGLFDMYGNVWEWCLDEWDSSLPSGIFKDPVGPAGNVNAVIRGGSYLDANSSCNSTYRYWLARVGSGQNIGFRVVLGQPVP